MTEAKPEAQAKATRDGRSFWLFVGLSLLLALVVMVGLKVGVGVAIDPPTLALAIACVVMVWSLRAMWGIVIALARPVVETILVEGEAIGPRGGRQRSDLADLREEKRRVLRAIKELEFDHAMRKLSDEDFKLIGDRYRLRAIEVIRALAPLEGSADLHPLLAEHLAAVGITHAQLDQLDQPDQQDQPDEFTSESATEAKAQA